MYYDAYLVLCGMVWAQLGEQNAGLELIRALDSPDQVARVLARTLLQQANGGSKELIAEALTQAEISVSMANLCGFDGNGTSDLRSFSPRAWFAEESA
jgi:hypothetical protein